MKKVKGILIATMCSLAAAAQKGSSPVIPAVDAYIKNEMKTIGIPGMAVAVIRDGKVIHSQTYGIANMEWNQPVTANTVFHIASVTKLFTSTLVMKWLQQGKMHLQDPISLYIKNCPEKWKDIRIEHLLSHESGIMWPAASNSKIETSEELVNALKDSALTFPTGTKEAYMNGDYFVLQHILESIGGKPIQQLLADEVFQPLGMTGSGFDLEQRGMPTLTMKPLLYKSQIFTKGITAPLIFKNIYTQTSYAAAGLYLSIADAIKWATALDQGTFINKEMQEQMVLPMPLMKEKTNSFTQLGWTREINNGHLVVGHSGGPGLGDVIRLPQEKLTVIVLSNYADIYPYMAMNIAKLFVKDLKLEEAPKTYDRKMAR